MKISSVTKFWLYLSVGILFISGVTWLIAHYYLSAPSIFEIKISPLEPFSLKVHGFAAIIFLIVFGALSPTHIRAGLVSGKNKQLGFLLLSVIAILILTGYAIYYLSFARNIISWGHIIMGLLLPVIIYTHILSGMKK